MNDQLHIEQRAERLPQAWDELAEHYFQRRVFLVHAEAYNPCHQRYYLWYEAGQLQAAAIAYTLPLDLLTFLKIRSPLRMHIIGVPCSVSCSGIFGIPASIPALKECIFQQEKGLCLFLNLPEEPHHSQRITGPTLPTVIFQNSFAGWEDYLAALRTDYRRRLNKIRVKGDALQLSRGPCSAFTPLMYQQYRQVFHHSNAKLEQLSLAFFQHLPEHFQLLKLEKKGQVVGWAITLPREDHYYFFLGGVDYAANQEYDIYFQLLAVILKEGINAGAVTIDLGQTAEIPKTRLGGHCVKRYLEGQHSHRILNRILKVAENALVYQRQVPETHVLKQGYENSTRTA